MYTSVTVSNVYYSVRIDVVSFDVPSLVIKHRNRRLSNSGVVVGQTGPGLTNHFKDAVTDPTVGV